MIFDLDQRRARKGVGDLSDFSIGPRAALGGSGGLWRAQIGSRWHREFREQADALYDSYLLDRPRRRTMSGWPKQPGPERFDRHSYPYDLEAILASTRGQDVDVELNT